MPDRVFVRKRQPVSSDARVAVVVGRYNAQYGDGLLAGCRRALAETRIADRMVTVDYVPGAFELPLAAQWLARISPAPDAVIALGTVIRGDTPHFDYISSCCLDGLAQVALATDIPVSCGVLTVETGAQALLRSGDDDNNRGYQAACAAFDMINLRNAMRSRGTPDR